MHDLESTTPMGLAVLSATMLYLKKRHAYDVGIYVPPREPHLRETLKEMRFERVINEPEESLLSSIEEMVQRGGLVYLREEKDCARAAGLLADFLQQTTKMSGEIRMAFEFCLSEVAENAFRHSKSTTGAIVSAQVLPSGKVEIAVVDTGIGLRESFRGTKYDAFIKSDVEAIKFAVRPEVTSKPGKHAGVGLFFTRKILVATDGEFLVYSHNGRLRFSGPECLDQRAPFWPGTIVAMRLRQDKPFTVAAIFGRYRTAADVALELEI